MASERGLSQPFALMTITSNVPDVETVMLCVVSPFDHKYPSNPSVAVSVTLSPSQKVLELFEVIIGVGGNGLTVTSMASEGGLSQPSKSLTMQLYMPGVLTMTSCVIAPFDHK